MKKIFILYSSSWWFITEYDMDLFWENIGCVEPSELGGSMQQTLRVSSGAIFYSLCCCSTKVFLKVICEKLIESTFHFLRPQ